MHTDPHLQDGWCQCRCDECTARLIGGCVCLECRCGIDDDDEHIEEHNWLAGRTHG